MKNNKESKKQENKDLDVVKQEVTPKSAKHKIPQKSHKVFWRRKLVPKKAEVAK